MDGPPGKGNGKATDNFQIQGRKFDLGSKTTYFCKIGADDFVNLYRGGEMRTYVWKKNPLIDLD